jgi:mono/diheme cytochrome c family protein
MIIEIKPIPRWLMTTLIVLVIIVSLGAWFAWYEFFREEPEQVWQAENGHSAEDMRFLYGSVGGERDSGIPYWIMYVLPQVFPDKLPGRLGKPPGAGGYAAFGLDWEQGHALPIGFTTKVIGFKRVAQSCAACHVASFRSKPGENPIYYPTAPNHTFNLEEMFRFLVDCAKDPRFNADRLMTEIDLVKPKDFTFVDELIYRYILIPITKQRLIEREKKFAWIFIHHPPQQWPDWGRGRDDAMNLTKYFLTTAPLDDTLGPTDMPSIWNLKKYNRGPFVATPTCGKDPVASTRMNFAGDSCNARSVIIDSSLGLLGAAPPSNQIFLNEIDWLENYLSNYPPPKYPYPIDQAKIAGGKTVFDQHCARCHSGNQVGTVMPLTEVDPVSQKTLGTDIERVKSWNKDAAIRANNAVKSFGITRPGLVEANPTGYIRAFLDGIWLRAPYLHNGSVPSLRDLLAPPAQRPQMFFRGYDVYDPLDLGFVSMPAQAARVGATWDEVLRVATPYDVHMRSNGNGGHEWGTDLPPDQKDALLEYLKTL